MGIQAPTKALYRWADRILPETNIFLKLLHNLLRLVLITANEFKKNDLGLRSGALTYTVLLSLVPMLAMSTAVVKGLGGGDHLQQVAYSYIDTLDQSTPKKVEASEERAETATSRSDLDESKNQPESSTTITTHLRSALDKLFDYVDKTNFATLGSFGVAGVLLSIVLVFGNIEVAMNAIWHVEKSRSITRKIADYLTLLVLMPISINVAFAASAFLKNPTLASKFELLIPFTWMQTLILKCIPVFFIGLTLYVIYIFFPNTRVRTGPALAGAFLAALLWFSVQNIYINLQLGVSNYNAIYGSFATLPLFLVWMYLGWLFILAGAQFAYSCQHLHNYTLVPTSNMPARKLSAAFDIMDLVHKSFKENKVLTFEIVCDTLNNYSQELLAEVTEQLQKSQILHCSMSGGRLLPASSTKQLNTQVLIDAIWGSETPDSPGGQKSKLVLQGASQNSLDLSGESEGV